MNFTENDDDRYSVMFSRNVMFSGNVNMNGGFIT